MAQNTSALGKSYRRNRQAFPVLPRGVGKKLRMSPLLYFPLPAKALRTPFRAKVLQSLYEIARKELGNRIESVVVQTSADHDAPGPIRLLLSIWANVAKHEWDEADRAISKAIFDQEATWTEDERADYLKMVDFEILSLKI